MGSGGADAGLAPAVVELAVDIAAAPGAVWAFVVDPARAPEWLGGFRVASTWVVGGPFALVGDLGGRRYREAGTLLALDPPRRLRYEHWSALWRVPDTADNRAVVTIELAPIPEGTRVTLHHALPAVEAIAPHARFFWRGGLEQLRRRVEAAAARA